MLHHCCKLKKHFQRQQQRTTSSDEKLRKYVKTEENAHCGLRVKYSCIMKDSLHFKPSWEPKQLKWHMMDGHSLQHPPSPQTYSSTQPVFNVLSLNSHFSRADLRKGAQWPRALLLQLHTAGPLCPPALGSRGQHVCATHLTSNNKSTFHFYMRHLKPSLHAKQSSHLRGGQAPPGLKMLIRACPFFSRKIILPSAFKRVCSQHFLKGVHWSLTESMNNSFQLYSTITSPLTS